MSSRVIDIWSVAYAAYASRVMRFWTTLSRGEKKFSSQFFLKQDRDRYIITRGLLRHLIGIYVGVPPDKIAFTYTSQGKPSVLNHALTFNVSHSRDQLVCAFSSRFSLGIDIEYMCVKKPIDQLARRYFSRTEQNRLASFNNADKAKAFYRGWVQKEAITKALGYGLNIPLRSIELPLHSITQPTKYNWENKKTLVVYPIDASKNFVGALAVDVKDCLVKINYPSNFPVIN